MFEEYFLIMIYFRSLSILVLKNFNIKKSFLVKYDIEVYQLNNDTKHLSCKIL